MGNLIKKRHAERNSSKTSSSQKIKQSQMCQTTPKLIRQSQTCQTIPKLIQQLQSCETLEKEINTFNMTQGDRSVTIPKPCMKMEIETKVLMPDDVYKEILATITNISSNNTQGQRDNYNKYINNNEKEVVGSLPHNNVYNLNCLSLEESMFRVDATKIERIHTGFKLSFVNYNNNQRTCLICNTTCPNNLYMFYEHLCDRNHIKNSKKVLSDTNVYVLLKHCMRKVSTRTVWCYPCNYTMDDTDQTVAKHIKNKSHIRKSEKLFAASYEGVTELLEEIKNNWCNIQKYSCVPCKKQFELKYEFVTHITGHSEKNNKQDSYVYDFCIPCATFWLGPSDTYAAHCKNKLHKYLTNSKDLIVGHIHKDIQKLLFNHKQTVNQLIKSSNSAEVNRYKYNEIETSVIDTLKSSFLDVTVHLFGSRMSGLALSNSDIDIFVNCGSMYHGNEISSLCHLKQAEACFSNNGKTWEIMETVYKATIPIIRLQHRQTGLQCDASFTNGLSVENTKLIRSYVTAFTPCRQLILFLKKWLSMCNLPGPSPITSYAFAWCVIFYLQMESILPSVHNVKKDKDLLQPISGWEIPANYDIPPIASQKSFSELLLGFFKFYADFNYRYDVACPITGSIIKKVSFVHPETLPLEMASYKNHVNSRIFQVPEYFRIDSVLCIQDPLHLSRNLTKAVSNVTLKFFKRYCKESADILYQQAHAKSSEALLFAYNSPTNVENLFRNIDSRLKNESPGSSLQK